MSFDPSIKIGVLGGGQLGRMMIQSAIDLNLDIAILDPDPMAPCHSLTSKFHCGSITDFDTVYDFGKSCDLITIEIENVNTDALKKLQNEGISVYPQPEVLEIIKDKGIQKDFYVKHDIPTSDYVLTKNKEDVLNYTEYLPAAHKLRTEGYDGRGVSILRASEDLSKAFDAPGVLEKFVDYEKEISIIVARNARGEVSVYPPVELEYHPEKNLVEFLFSPSDISQEITDKANQIAIKLIKSLEMIGLLAAVSYTHLTLPTKRIV